MKKLFIIASLFTLSSCSLFNTKDGIFSETSMTYLLPVGAIDYYPMWSKHGRYLAYPVGNRDEGGNHYYKWYKVDLFSAKTSSGSWRGGKKIKIIDDIDKKEISDEELKTFKSQTKFNKDNPRKLTTKNGDIYQLTGGGKTTFLINKKGKEPAIQWKSAGENCHSISSYKDEKFVAFICELNGIILYRTSNK